ncbi:PREDICTED: protein RNA-directed DNA methylation 3-like [Camelina sativa]|uniref:Protein RNA-directed DNA methylation 3-like n=1 Tax=Camelina sativa TaxID=90675 RepID=A0ABM0V7Y5_CAMSA|nr:PREDICTED: protein RNA-directed DNA methylation 3-like [Camelina sativa]
MDRKGKGKQVAASGGKKRKNTVEFRDEGLRIKKRKNPQVLQFFEESAEVGYYGGSSDEDDDGLGFLNDMEDEPEVEESGKAGKGEKGNSSFVFPKEEDINEEEFDRIMEERYKPGSGFLRYADDDVKDSIEMDALAPTSKDPPIWKVKCAIGREKHSVFCLMHKFVEMKKTGTKLQIISVFFADHVKGFIFIEAEKERDVLEACNNLTGIYATRMVLVSKAETPNLLTVQRKTKKVSEGTWARVKNGKYKGDLAQIVAVSDTRKKALVKLIPRIDIQALTQKYGAGVTIKKGQTPAPRLISSSELEEFRPLIQVRRDRDTGMTFEHLDSLMLKDGYLYKKVSLDSLSSWGVTPSKEEILKFTPVDRKEAGDVEWISEIYGEEKKKNILPTGRGGGKGEGSGGGKGEGSSESKSESSYELYNLVCFSRKDFGLIVGVDDKGDGYKVLKEGLDGPVVVSVGKKEMQNGPFDSKFTALDLNNKQISVNDVVKISKGPSEGKQGVVRQVYRGIIFLYDESEEENGGYFCCKSQSCEKVKLFTEDSNEKTGGFDASAFGDSVSSPKSPLSPEKEWQPRERYTNSNKGDRGSMYSIGQKLRIRVGPLKGYLCRVIALRYSDVTVKLDSQHKLLTVKSEHLAEVRDRNTVLSTSGDPGSGSFQPFDMLGTEGSSGDWAKGVGTSGEVGNWNIGATSTDLNTWGSKPTSDISFQQPTVPDDNTSTWTNAAAENKSSSASDQPGGWNSWDKPPASEAGTVGGWGDAGASKVETSSWEQGAADLGSWGTHGRSSDGNKQEEDSVWGKLCEASESGLEKGIGESNWGNKEGNSSASNKEGVSWGQQDKGFDGSKGGSAWDNQGGGFGSGERKDGSSGWNKSAEDSNASSKGVPGWCKPDDGSSWGNQDKGGSSCVEPDGGSSWSKQDGGSWGKKDDGGSSWGKKDDGHKDDGGSSWSKKVDGGSSWGKKDDGGSSWSKKDDGGSSGGKTDDGGSSWGKKNDGGSSWGEKNDGGSSWDKKEDGHKDNGGSSWSKNVDGGSSWGNQDDGGSSWGKKDDGGSSWGKKNDGGSSWDKKDDGHKDNGGSSWAKHVEGGSSWGKKDDGGSSWGKKNDGGSSWDKKDDGHKDNGGSSWAKTVDGGFSWGKKDDGGSSWGKKDVGGSSWGKKDDGGSSWDNKYDGGYSGHTFDRGGRGFGGRRGGRRGGRDQSGRGRSLSNSEDPTPWNKPSGGSSWGKQDGVGGNGSAWGKQNNDTSGGSSWDRQNDGDSKPWNEHNGVGRGFGGRRGGGGFRGGFRGGRNQSGREGGRSFDGDQSSSWKTDNQENTWKSDQSGGSDWKKGWGKDSNGSKPSGTSSGGCAGNWPSWDANSKKETNDKPGNESKSACGTSDEQEKPNSDVGTSGEADNAWGGKTNAVASSPSGSAAWGTGDKKSGW